MERLGIFMMMPALSKGRADKDQAPRVRKPCSAVHVDRRGVREACEPRPRK
jgi:hypothetical protein